MLSPEKRLFQTARMTIKAKQPVLMSTDALQAFIKVFIFPIGKIRRQSYKSFRFLHTFHCRCGKIFDWHFVFVQYKPPSALPKSVLALTLNKGIGFKACRRFI